MTAALTSGAPSANDFQQRMFEKVRESLGALMTDAELKVVVDQATQKAFFEERKVPRGGYSSGWETLPPLFVELIQKELQPRFEAAIKTWATEHPEIIEKALQDAIGGGITRVLLTHINEKLNGPLWEMGQALRNKGII